MMLHMYTNSTFLCKSNGVWAQVIKRMLDSLHIYIVYTPKFKYIFRTISYHDWNNKALKVVTNAVHNAQPSKKLYGTLATSTSGLIQHGNQCCQQCIIRLAITQNPNNALLVQKAPAQLEASETMDKYVQVGVKRVMGNVDMTIHHKRM